MLRGSARGYRMTQPLSLDTESRGEPMHSSPQRRSLVIRRPQPLTHCSQDQRPSLQIKLFD